MDVATLELTVKSDQVRRASGDLDRFSREGKRASQAADQVSSRSQRMGAAVGKAAVGFAGIVASAATVGRVVSTLRDFDASMQKVAAISGATADEMAQLRNTAKELGASTEFSASQAADALGFLAMAGFDAQESMAAMPGVLDLATASGMDFARTADITTSILAGFGIEAAQVNKVTDALAAQASSSKTSVDQLGAAMSYVAPVSKTLGISVGDTAAAIGVLSDSGVQGTRAGTALRAMLSKLVDPTDAAADALADMNVSLEDIDPTANSLDDILQTLADANIDLATATELVGIEAASNLITLSSNVDKYREYSKAQENVEGTTKKMAATMRDQLGGSFANLNSAIEGLIIELGDAGLTDVIRTVVDTVTDLVRALAGLDNLSEIAMGFAAVAGAALAMVFPFAAAGVAAATAAMYVWRNWDSLSEQFPALTGAIESALSSLGPIFSWVRERAVEAFQGAAERLEHFIRLFDALFAGDWKTAWEEFRAIVEGIGQSFLDMIPEIEINVDKLRKAVTDKIEEWGGRFYGYVIAEVGEIGDAIGDGVTWLRTNVDKLRDAAVKKISEWGQKFFEEAKKAAMKIAEGILEAKQAVVNAINEVMNVSEEQKGTILGNFKAFGQQVAAGFESGIKSYGGNPIAGFAERIITGFKQRFKIDSPSKVFKEFGDNTVEGFVKGIDEGTGDAVRAIENMADQSIESAESIFRGGIESAVDYMVDGFRDGLGGLVDIFVNTLKSMAAAAIKSRIFIPISAGVGGGGLAGTIAQAAGGGGGLLGGGGGLLGGLLGNFGTVGGGIFGGLGGGVGLLGGLGNAVSGGIGNIFNIGTNALAAGGGIGATIGAALPVIGIAAAAFSLFIGKTKLLDKGLRVTVDSMDALIETFSLVEKSRLFGLIKSKDKNYSPAPSELADPIRSAVADIQGEVLETAKVLGIGADAFKNFTTQIEVSTKGLSEEEAQQAVIQALSKISDEMAAVALGAFEYVEKEVTSWKLSMVSQSEKQEGEGWWTNKQVTETVKEMTFTASEFSKEGETTSQTLQRLAQSLITVNDAMRLLDQGLLEASLAGGAAASRIVEAAGGLDNFSTSVQTYFTAFYSAEEQLEIQTELLADRVEELGFKMPKTRAEFRAMVESIDITTESGQTLYGQMIALAGAMDSVLPVAEALSMALTGAIGRATTEIDAMLATANQNVREAESNARLWYRTAETLRDFVGDLINSDLSPMNPMQMLEANAMRYADTFEKIQQGDREAAKNFQNVAVDYLESAKANASSEVEFRRAAAKVMGDAKLAAGISELEGANQDVLRYLYEQQVDVLTELKEYLMSGQPLDNATLKRFENKLGALQGAIEEAEMFSYEYLKERLKVTVDIIADADVPKYIKNLLKNAADGIESTIKYVLMTDDLTPDLKWLALQAASEHIKELKFLVEESDVPVTRWPLLIEDITNGVRKIRILADYSDKISDPVRFLLSAIRGTAEGFVRLGGNFEFDPSKAFRTFFEDRMRTPMSRVDSGLRSIITPMDRLREALKDLRKTNRIESLRMQFAVLTLERANTTDRARIRAIDEQRLKLQTKAKYIGGGVKQFAEGGTHSGGWRMVGERGVELEYTGPSRIYNNKQTREMLSGLGNSPEMRRLNSALEGFRREQRQLGMRVDRHMKKIADLNRKWDIDGLPAERTNP